MNPLPKVERGLGEIIHLKIVASTHLGVLMPSRDVSVCPRAVCVLFLLILTPENPENTEGQTSKRGQLVCCQGGTGEQSKEFPPDMICPEQMLALCVAPARGLGAQME